MGQNTHKLLFLSLVTAINLASAEYVTKEINELVEELLYYFVEQFQMVYSLRHMSSNIHSLLHMNESLKLIGPLWMCSTFSLQDILMICIVSLFDYLFISIDKDLMSIVHGITSFEK